MVMMLRHLLLFCALVVTACVAHDLRGQIQPNAELPHLINLGPNTKVVLQAVPTAPVENLAQLGQTGDRVTWVAADGSFTFKNIPQGAYTLNLLSRTHAFNSYRVDVADNVQIRLFTPGTALSSILSNNLIMHPLILHALQRRDFFTEAAPLTLTSLLGMGGPMMILGLVAMGLVFLMPKLTAMMDPETQKELADSQAKMHKRMAAFQSGTAVTQSK